MAASTKKPFLSDIEALRKRARRSLSQGAVTPAYRGDVNQTIEILQTVLATEIVCVLRYTQHSIAAAGISSEAIKEEFATHAREEQAHMMSVAERINQLGGKPDFNPELLISRSASQYAEGETLVDMLRDPTTRVMLEGILGVEEEHASDMHDLLVAHEGVGRVRA